MCVCLKILIPDRVPTDFWQKRIIGQLAPWPPMGVFCSVLHQNIGLRRVKLGHSNYYLCFTLPEHGKTYFYFRKLGQNLSVRVMRNKDNIWNDLIGFIWCGGHSGHINQKGCLILWQLTLLKKCTFCMLFSKTVPMLCETWLVLHIHNS